MVIFFGSKFKYKNIQRPKIPTGTQALYEVAQSALT